MAHGTQDPVVKYDWGVSSKDVLLANAYQLEWHTFPIAHEACAEELQALSGFLKKILT